jgi:hypothetical protein
LLQWSEPELHRQAAPGLQLQHPHSDPATAWQHCAYYFLIFWAKTSTLGMKLSIGLQNIGKFISVFKSEHKVQKSVLFKKYD